MLLAIPFLLLLLLLLPLLGWMSHRQSPPDDAELPSLTAMAIQTGVLQTIVAGLGVLALVGADLSISWPSTMTYKTLALAMVILLVFVAIAHWEAKRPLGPKDRLRAEFRKVSAGNPTWLGVILYAGIIEEFAYRGVLTLVLASFLGFWPAALVSAMAFALAHLSGGWRSVIMGVPFALAMQTLAYVSGGLALAILVHVAYDVAAAYLGYRLARQSAS